MPKSIEFKLDSLNPLTPPLPDSIPLESTLVGWISRAEKQVAINLRDSKSMRPYTISSMTFSKVGKKDVGKFRVTILNDDLWDVLRRGSEDVLAHSPEVKILGMNFLMKELTIIKQDTFESLLAYNENMTEIILNFKSPTSFLRGDKDGGVTQFPFPEPTMVFSSLQSKWNEFAPYSMNIEPKWIEWVSKSIKISHGIPSIFLTQRLGVEQEIPNFMGKIKYKVQHKKKDFSIEEHEQSCRIANALANYAYYSGVGIRTNLGFGQTIKLEKWTELVKTVKTKFFISYSSKDKNVATKISDFLKEQGYNTWLDQKDIAIGQSILDRVAQGINNESDFVLILLSKNSANSDWCKLELRMAYQKEMELKRIVVLPIRIDDVDVPIEVQVKKYHQLNIRSKASMKSLIKEIDLLLASEVHKNAFI